MGVTVVVPWQGGDPHREAALEWVKARYDEIGWSLALSQQHGGEWSKANAIMQAVSLCDEIVVLADADCWCDGVARAVRAVEDGAAWAVPHSKVHRLTRESTACVLAGADPAGLPTEQPPYRGVKGGGIVVTRRETLREIPFDRRYVGWGRTDLSWREAMKTLVGFPWRDTTAPLWHLWHPPQERPSRTTGSPENEALYRRYLEAYGNEDAMRSLLRESLCTR